MNFSIFVGKFSFNSCFKRIWNYQNIIIIIIKIINHNREFFWWINRSYNNYKVSIITDSCGKNFSLTLGKVCYNFSWEFGWYIFVVEFIKYLELDTNIFISQCVFFEIFDYYGFREVWNVGNNITFNGLWYSLALYLYF